MSAPQKGLLCCPVLSSAGEEKASAGLQVPATWSPARKVGALHRTGRQECTATQLEPPVASTFTCTATYPYSHPAAEQLFPHASVRPAQECLGLSRCQSMEMGG